MTQCMANQKKSDEALSRYMRFLRMCKLLLSEDFSIGKIDKSNEFYADAVETARMDKIDLEKATAAQGDTIILDMLYNAWNDINVGGNIKIFVTFEVDEKSREHSS